MMNGRHRRLSDLKGPPHREPQIYLFSRSSGVAAWWWFPSPSSATPKALTVAWWRVTIKKITDGGVRASSYVCRARPRARFTGATSVPEHFGQGVTMPERQKIHGK